METVPKTRCLRCGGRMENTGTRRLQLGQAGFFTGSWSNLLSGSLEVEVYVCSGCGKTEFYSPQAGEDNPCDPEGEEVPEPVPADDEKAAGRQSVSCPYCGMSTDPGYPICPYCGKPH